MNNFIFTGKINSDLELRKTKNDKDYASFLVLLDSRYSGKTAGNIKIAVFYDDAKLVCNNFKKGDYVFVESYVEVRKDEKGKYNTNFNLSSIKNINGYEIRVENKVKEGVKNDNVELSKEESILEVPESEVENKEVEIPKNSWDFYDDKNPLDEEELPFFED